MLGAICAMAPGRKTNRTNAGGGEQSHLRAFTLIEMLVAMAITLVMMGAVVTLFANLSNSVRNRRATTEMAGQLRHVRNVLQQDLQGATCPGVTWQRPESNHGYIEIIEGPHKEGYASDLIDADPLATPSPVHWPPSVGNPEIDHKLSALPSSNLPFKDPSWATDGGGLGDDDDILMLTVRNEHEPFNGRAPSNVRNGAQAQKFAATGFWDYETIQSPLAEVVWFSIENPGYTDETLTDPSANHFFGEPGFRTIYRRTLLIAPWLNPYRLTASGGTVNDTFTFDGATFKAQPGLMRILPKNIALEEAIAAVVAFQDRYDLSVRLEWDGDMDIPNGRWKIVANTLGDLTKRENRFQHFGYRPVVGNKKPIGREYPFAFISAGLPVGGKVQFVTDPDVAAATPPAKATAISGSGGLMFNVTDPGTGYFVRPFAFINEDCVSMGTARAMLNDEGSVVRMLPGPVPLWGARRGEDVMITDALAFDLRVYDPGAPVFASRKIPGDTTNFDLDVVLTPSDPGWRGSAPDGAGGAYFDNIDHMKTDGSGKIGTNNKNFQFVGQGAYVDMGYGYDKDFLVDQSHVGMPGTRFFTQPVYFSALSSVAPWFFTPRAITDVYGTQLAPGYAVYDTWSFHYENNGINEDGFWYDTKWNWHNPVANAWETTPPAEDWRKIVDQGVDGVDNQIANSQNPNSQSYGIDEAHERETRPAYDVPLRGMQALIRAYEHDSRAIRQVRVNQHFMQE